jgi:hypothetical protein
VAKRLGGSNTKPSRQNLSLLTGFLWSPLSDSNRRPPLYKWSRAVLQISKMAQNSRKIDDFDLG